MNILTRVELGDQFPSLELVYIFGQTQVKQVPLVPTLPCHLDDTPTAHCDGSETCHLPWTEARIIRRAKPVLGSEFSEKWKMCFLGLAET